MAKLTKRIDDEYANASAPLGEASGMFRDWSRFGHRYAILVASALKALIWPQCRWRGRGGAGATSISYKKPAD
jgi:hypothetical protein